LGGVFLFFHAVDKAANSMFNKLFRKPASPAPKAVVLLQVFIPAEDEDLTLIFTSACQEAGGRSSPHGEGDTEVFFSIPAGHLAGVDWYIGLLEASGLWWSLIEK
jgi:hypothetical protein